MKTIRTYVNPVEAGFAHSLLEASGIYAALLDEHAGTSGMGVGFVPWGMRLQVAEEDAERAVEILDRRIADADESAPAEVVPLEREVGAMVRAAGGVTCPNCGTLWELSPEQASEGEFTCEECKTTFPIAAADATEQEGVCVTCPHCGTEWELTAAEAAMKTFTCGSCQTTFSIVGQGG